jgi:hypothetical protein
MPQPLAMGSVPGNLGHGNCISSLPAILRFISLFGVRMTPTVLASLIAFVDRLIFKPVE